MKRMVRCASNQGRKGVSTTPVHVQSGQYSDKCAFYYLSTRPFILAVFVRAIVGFLLRKDESVAANAPETVQEVPPWMQMVKAKKSGGARGGCRARFAQLVMQ